MKNRRNTLLGLGALSAWLAGARALFTSNPAEAAAPARAYEISKTDAEWKALLRPDQYTVLRKAGTERAYSSSLNNEKRAGTYSCAGCALPLFASSTKFDSRTGWPSFWKPLDQAVVEEVDRSMLIKRTEVLCRRCGGHLGHVFNDGPRPTGLRYCINGVALNFTAS